MNHSARSVSINGSLLRQIRIDRGWTQTELAKRSGYSSRLIRKAESGGAIDLETLSNLAEALSIPEERISTQQLGFKNDLAEDASVAEPPSQFATAHLEIAKAFVRCYDAGGKSFEEKCGHLYTEDAEFHCPAEPGVVPFAGVWRGAEGIQGFFDAFYGLFSRQCNTLVPDYLCSAHRVVARYEDQVFFQGHEMPPFWVNLHFQFRDGRCFRVDDEFDQHNAKRSFEELLQRLGMAPPP